MSDIVEKTLASIPKFLGSGLLGVGAPSSPKHPSARGFTNFLRVVQKTRSKNEEEQIVRHEISEMQHKLSLPETTKQQTCDCLCQAVYCNLLGYDMSSLYIHAVKLAQQGGGFEKRLGYLACSLLMNENHELILLLINTIQKDLNSSNLLDNCVALTVICQLVNSELIPSVLPLVQEKLKHPRELVRMKAAMCIHQFLLKTPSMVDHFVDQFPRILFDKDPGVMSVGVQIYDILIKSDRTRFPKLTENLIGILEQVMNRRLPSEFEFHNVPMPWLQMDIIRMLGTLGAGNQGQSERMYAVLREVIKRTDMKERVAYAILYECIVTISTIHPNKELLREATTSVSRFVRSTNPTLKYTGIKALTVLVKSCPEAALEHQLTVVELLDDKDQAIQRKTLDLLFCMANPSNVQVVCDKLLEHVGRNVTNTYLQLDLANKVLQLADKFASSSQWYVDTVYRLLGTCKVPLPGALMDNVISVIEKDCGSDTRFPNTKEFQQYLVKKSLGNLFLDEISAQQIRLSVWILGECGSLLQNMPSDKVFSLVLKHFHKRTLDVSTRLWMTSSLTKLVCAKVLDRDVVTKRLTEARDEESNVVIRQKLTEILKIIQYKIDVTLPVVSASPRHPEQMDFTLSFLDEFVSRSLAEGGQPYRAKTLRGQPPQHTPALFRGINGITKDTTEAVAKETLSQGSTTSGPRTTGSDGGSGLSGGQRESGLNLQGVKRVWGKQGAISDSQGDTLSRSESPPRGDNQYEHGSPVDLGVDRELEEAKAKKMELASALFSGITSSSTHISGPDNMEMSPKYQSTAGDSGSHGSEGSESPLPRALSPKPHPVTDTGGWRNLHKKATTEIQASAILSNEIAGNSSTQTENVFDDSLDRDHVTGFSSEKMNNDSPESDLNVPTNSVNIPDLGQDATSIYTEGNSELLSDLNAIMNPHSEWGHTTNRDASYHRIDDRPCFPGSTSAHSLYDVTSPENTDRQFVTVETENSQHCVNTETLYDEYTDEV